MLLQSRGNMSAPELAEELEVSVRTIYRDCEALSAAGVPIYAEPGRGGGIRLVDGWRTRLTGLTGPEADALLLAGVPGAAAELGLGTVLAAAQLKVLAALPPELRSRANRVSERFHLDAPGWFRTADELPHLPTVSEAVWDDRQLRMSYDKQGQVSERIVHPLGLVLKAGVWYLIATHNSELRTYRVSRIVDAEILPERITRPEGFDLAAHWDESSSQFQQSLLRYDVVARVRITALGYLQRIVDPASWVRIEKQLAEREPGASGEWVTITIGTEMFGQAFGIMLRLAGDAEVLEPAELRERLADTARSMAERYGTTSSPVVRAVI